MARSVAMLIVKWLLIPAALTAIGYYVVGPRIGATLKNSVAAPQPESTTESASRTTAANAVSYPAPDVELKVNEAKPNKRPKRRRPKRRTAPKVEKAAPANETAPPPDQGGSGGAATTGGDTGGTDGGSTGGGDQSGGDRSGG